mmetsp:Transcript_19621/g.37113  ORF Transcript_19621/g.37113 Transcript_19621/m.37113 type:complete len:642 (-) Transcript_19621:26-1951(-)
MTDTSTSTPKNNSNSATQTPSSTATTSISSRNKGQGRWKQARIEEDPIIAPGYGRQSDLERLTSALNRESAVKLPVSAVEALMKAKGRGIRSSARTAETPSGRGTSSAAAAATPISSAWADFMKEEGVNVNNTTSTAAAASAKKDDDEDEQKPAAVAEKTGTAAESRNYLPLPWESKEPTSKKARGAADAGYLVQAGTLDASIVGRGKLSNADFAAHPYHLARPTVLKLPTMVTKVFSAGHSVHAICLDANGQVHGWGRNEGQQLGSSRPNNVYWPTPLDDFDSESPIVQAATGKSHTLFLNKDGEVWALGSNKFGQCGVKPGPASETVGTPRITAVPDGVEMAEISCGEDFSMAISTQGRLYSTGCSQYGQLGNGETGEYFITANKLAFSNCAVWTPRTTFCEGSSDDKVAPVADSETILVRQVACGKHHTLVVEAPAENHKARVFSFGCGDYGCLGHGVQKDEYFPRQIAVFNNAPIGDDSEVRLAAGNSCSLVQTSAGHVYYWGKHRSVGEAVMRPQLVDVLANNQHIVTHMAAGSQTVVCTTQHGQTVAWGQGPHGELGLKSGAKSSAKPGFVDDLNECHVTSMAASYGSLIYVVSEEDEKNLGELPTLEADDVTDLTERADAPPAEKGKKGRKRKS